MRQLQNLTMVLMSGYQHRDLVKKANMQVKCRISTESFDD